MLCGDTHGLNIRRTEGSARGGGTTAFILLKPCVVLNYLLLSFRLMFCQTVVDRILAVSLHVNGDRLLYFEDKCDTGVGFCSIYFVRFQPFSC